jgi:hypothetical protein
MQNSLEKLLYRYEIAQEAFNMVVVETQTVEFLNEETTISFYKHNYFPKAVEVNIAQRLWEFESDFPVGNLSRKQDYIYQKYEELYHFF